MPNPTRGEGNTNSPELLLFKFLPIAYNQAISWPPPWISHLFHNGLLGGCTLFLQLGCFGLDGFYFKVYIWLHWQW